MPTTHKGECFSGAVHVKVPGEPEAIGYAIADHAGRDRVAPSTLSPCEAQRCRVTAGAGRVPRSKRQKPVSANTARNAGAVL